MPAPSSDKITALRKLMAANGLSGFIVPRQDEFQGEYVAAYAERLKWLTGFSGSWGTAIILAKSAAIFVDGRYTSQVRQQVKIKGMVHKDLLEEPPREWAATQLKNGDKLGYDPMLITVTEARAYTKSLAGVGAKLVPVKRNLIDQLWVDQPLRTALPLFSQPTKFAGRSARQKLKSLTGELTRRKSDAVFIAEPSSVSWLFNLRGSDVPYTPVVLAFALVHASGKAELFVEAGRIKRADQKLLEGLVTFVPPEKLAERLKKLTQKKVEIDEGAAPDFVRGVLAAAKAFVVHAIDPCQLPKACKNDIEQEGARLAQRRDGAALCRFLHWFEHEARGGQLHEAEAAEKLRSLRAVNDLFVDLSFETIPASGPNAAIPHYHLAPGKGRLIGTDEIFLIDSGGQYRDGTTDVTRTVVVGTPSAGMKDRFTRVLKGMIAISRLHFPAGTTGAHIDALARESLWAAGLDFDHGTGHGVGSFLSVHEGPARISKAGHVVMRAGMILSNEPGYYKLGHFGIRTENLLLVVGPNAIEGGERKMLGFETLTLAPIDHTLVNDELLTREELQWLDHYHARVLAAIRPLVPEEVQAWLVKACSPLAKTNYVFGILPNRAK